MSLLLSGAANANHVDANPRNALEKPRREQPSWPSFLVGKREIVR